MENSLNNEEKNKNKLSYINGLFMYIDYIKENFLTNRNKIESIINIYQQKIKIEEQLSSTINKLCVEFISKYKKKDFETSFDCTIKKIIEFFIEESSIIEEKNKNIKNLIDNLKGCLNNQKTILDEMIKMNENSQVDFKIINELLKERELNFLKAGKDLELSMYKLERAIINPESIKEGNEIKEELEKKNHNKKNNNNNDKNKDNKKQVENKMSEEDIILTYKKNKENYLKKANTIKYEYESFINVANEEREKYTKIVTQIYNQIQYLDEKFFNEIKEKFKKVFKNEIFYMNKYIDIKNSILNKNINLINVENDINTFINSKVVKFNIPIEIECSNYVPQVVLKNRNNPLESKITEKVNKEICKLLEHEKKIKNSKENNFIQQCIKLIIQEQDYEKDKLFKLLEQKLFRKLFLNALNQCRIEGIFELAQKAFDNLNSILIYLVKFAINDEDYESIKTTIILSQTFHLNTNKELFLHASIASNEVWKDKMFWEKIIDYSIWDEVNNFKGFSIFLEEDTKERKQRVESAIISNMITYLYNMKLFNYPEEKYKELIDDLIDKYKIDGSSIYATLDSINNEIENEKKNNDKNNILNKDTKEEKENIQDKKEGEDKNNKDQNTSFELIEKSNDI